MSRFQVDDDGELVRENGAFVRVETSIETIKMGIREAVLLIKTEAKFARRRGIRHFVGDETTDEEPSPFAKGVSFSLIETLYTREISLVPGVVEVIDIRLDQADDQIGTRAATLSFEVRVSVDLAEEIITGAVPVEVP